MYTNIMNLSLVTNIFKAVAKLVKRFQELFDKKGPTKEERITVAFDELHRHLSFTAEEVDRLRKAFETISKSHLAIIDDAFKCLRIHYTLVTLKAAKPLKTITFLPIFLTNLKVSFQMWPKPKGCAYPSLSNNVA